jgi:hypothetical protein
VEPGGGQQWPNSYKGENQCYFKTMMACGRVMRLLAGIIEKKNKINSRINLQNFNQSVFCMYVI